jgi:hypothetical protein
VRTLPDEWLAGVAYFFRRMSLSTGWFLPVDLFLVIDIAPFAKYSLAFLAPMLV